MTHTYKVTGITCEGCVAKVKSKLLMHPEVTAADVRLGDENVTITMQKHIPVDELQAAIGTDTKYKIAATHNGHSIAGDHMTETEASGSWLATYKPLLLIAVFIAGVSIIASGGELSTGMTYFMAGFFLVFSFFKFLDLKGFASSYAMYDVLAMRVPLYGYVYPFLELGLGIAYLTGFNPVVTNWATVIIMGFSSIGVIQSVLNKKKIRCACLGAVFNLPMSTVTIVEDLLMVGMAGLMLL
jgi:cation transport ATPase